MPPADTGPSHRAWLVVALLVPVALLNYLDRQMLASMKFSVMRDIPDIGCEANWGAILALFKWVYAFLSPVGGYLADRFSRRHVIAAACSSGRPSRGGPGTSRRTTGLLATRALMGISEAFYIPAALALIADFHAGPTRSRAVGLHQMGIYVGVIVGGFGGYAADHPSLGWRWAFDACGLVGMLYALPLYSVPAEPPIEPNGQAARGATSPVDALRELLEQRLVHPARALLHAAGAGRLGRARLDAGDPEGGVRHRAGPGRRVGDALLASRGDRRRDRRRLAGRSLDADAARAAASSRARSA